MGSQDGPKITLVGAGGMAFGPTMVNDVIKTPELAGSRLVLNISASPFNVGKRELRQAMLASLARRNRVPVVMVNQVGGNDSLVFDGSSLALNASGEVVAQAKSFEEDLILFDTATGSGDMHAQVEGEEGSAYAALVLGTRDYVRKCGFSKVVVGVSGGIDSALTAVIATDALGAGNVIGVAMPSQYSSEGSVTDARALAAKPKLLVSDEAMAGLSSAEVDEILEILLALNARGAQRLEKARSDIAKLGSKVAAVVADLATEAGCKALVEQAVDESRAGEPEIVWARRALRDERERARAWRHLLARGFPEEIASELLGEPG